MKKAIHTDKTSGTAGPYSKGLVCGKRVYVAGQGGKNRDGVLPEGIREQTRQTMENIKAILEAGGATMDHVVKSTVHLANLDDFAAFNEVYKQYFNEPYPVRTTVGSKLLGAMLVEVDVVAELD